MIITLTNISSCVAVAGGIIVCNLSLGLENDFFLAVEARGVFVKVSI